MRTALPSSTEVVALVLAAGQSRRFDGDKRRALLPDGRCLLNASIEQALQVFAEVWVVLRPEDAPEVLGLPHGIGIIRSELAERGMGHSLASGIRALNRSSACAVAILLGDMPWIAASSLLALTAAADPQRIAVPCYAGMRGHPVVFGRHFWPQLALSQGDEGARAVIKAHTSVCDTVHVDDPAILRDVDRREDLA